MNKISIGDFIVAVNHLYDVEYNYMSNIVDDLHYIMHHIDNVKRIWEFSETTTLTHKRLECGTLQLTVITPTVTMIYLIAQ